MKKPKRPKDDPENIGFGAWIILWCELIAAGIVALFRNKPPND